MNALSDGMESRSRAYRRSPTIGLVIGLLVTLAAVLADSWYITHQIAGLRALQTDLADRSRKDSLQLLRIQNDLNLVALAMRDMIDNDARYPLTAWSSQLDRVRLDLADALRQEETVAVARRSPEQRQFLADSVTQFWGAVDRMFAMARDGREDEARTQIRLSLLARQAALTTAVARLLVENNASEEQTAIRVEGIYNSVQRQVYLFLGATLAAIILASASVIRVNRRLFAELAALSERRHELAQQLIATRESTLREIARELHDEFGQILTAMGSMLGRAGKHAPEGSPLRADLREVCEIAQATLDHVRTLSQALHPSILEDAGLDEAVDWYVANAQRQLGLSVTLERSGPPVHLDKEVSIHVYRILQESLSNVSRHAGTSSAAVRLRATGTALELEVEDHGSGLNAATERRGLGIVTMRERAELLGGTIQFSRPAAGGTLV
ncbi:MAG TPA: sensor histidine kinase, partial [Vicinamibacterales bacterium]|nr:sensor histidine kinase [Vicinamibacterales bacterium]